MRLKECSVYMVIGNIGLLVCLSSCTNDQLVEIIEPSQVVVGPNHLVVMWELDSVKITTKEHPVEDGVAYEVLVWAPNPDEKDTLIIDESFFNWTKNNNIPPSLSP